MASILAHYCSSVTIVPSWLRMELSVGYVRWWPESNGVSHISHDMNLHNIVPSGAKQVLNCSRQPRLDVALSPRMHNQSRQVVTHSHQEIATAKT